MAAFGDIEVGLAVEWLEKNVDECGSLIPLYEKLIGDEFIGFELSGFPVAENKVVFDVLLEGVDSESEQREVVSINLDDDEFD